MEHTVEHTVEHTLGLRNFFLVDPVKLELCPSRARAVPNGVPWPVRRQSSKLTWRPSQAWSMGVQAWHQESMAITEWLISLDLFLRNETHFMEFCKLVTF